jgi:hypothetical protein
MARKQLDIVVSAEGRDKGKVFQITEMPSTKGEKWAYRAMLALGRSGVDIPDDMMSQGMAGLANVVAAWGITALLKCDFNDLEPLLDDMMACVKCVPDPTRPEVTRALVEDDIEEVTTRLSLRKDILSLHIDFFTAVAP